MGSLTAELVDLIRSKPVEPDDLTAASHFVLDTIASVVAGQRSAPGQLLRRWFDDVGHDVGRSMFLTGGLAHTLEIDDGTPTPTPALPNWGVLLLTLLLMGGGALVLARRRA